MRHHVDQLGTFRTKSVPFTIIKSNVKILRQRLLFMAELDPILHYIMKMSGRNRDHTTNVGVPSTESRRSTVDPRKVTESLRGEISDSVNLAPGWRDHMRMELLPTFRATRPSQANTFLRTADNVGGVIRNKIVTVRYQASATIGTVPSRQAWNVGVVRSGHPVLAVDVAEYEWTCRVSVNVRPNAFHDVSVIER